MHAYVFSNLKSTMSRKVKEKKIFMRKTATNKTEMQWEKQQHQLKIERKKQIRFSPNVNDVFH